jgi:hypothetical protein
LNWQNYTTILTNCHKTSNGIDVGY